MPKRSWTADSGEKTPRGPVPRNFGTMMPLSKRSASRLVAAGLSNKEIGSRLFLSERTVQTHVSKILNGSASDSRPDRKLG